MLIVKWYNLVVIKNNLWIILPFGTYGNIQNIRTLFFVSASTTLCFFCSDQNKQVIINN